MLHPHHQPQPTSSLKSSNLLSMFQRKLTHPTPIQLKILIQIQDSIPSSYRPPQDFTLADITIYTQKHVYQGTLKGRNIIKQLAWTVESMNTLLDCLKGKRENNKVETRFFPVKNDEENSQSSSNLIQNYIYQNICQISSGINLPLFSLQLSPSPLNPFLHMQKKFSSLQHTFRSRSLNYKQKQQHLKSQLNQIQAVQKQIIYSSTTQIQLMKKEFIKHVNKQKAKIRRLMGTVPVVNPVSGMIENRGRGIGGGIPEDNGLGRIVEKEQYQEQEKQQRTQSAKKPRQIKKVNRQQYNKPQPQKLQVEDSSQSHHSKFFSQSSSLSSKPLLNNNKNINIKRQKPHGQNRNHRFTQDHDSSSEQDNNQGLGQQDDKEKTFLELERERLQREKILNNGKKEEQGDVWEDLVI